MTKYWTLGTTLTCTGACSPGVRHNIHLHNKLVTLPMQLCLDNIVAHRKKYRLAAEATHVGECSIPLPKPEPPSKIWKEDLELQM